MTYAVEFGILRILIKEIELYRRVDQMRFDLAQNYTFDPIDLFYSVKGGRDSKSTVNDPEIISSSDVQKFLRDFSIIDDEIGDNLVKCIMRRVSKELSGDPKIKYSDFIDTFAPAQLCSLNSSLKMRNYYNTSPKRKY